METIAFSGQFTLDRSRHAAVQVYEYLREQIVDLTLKPGMLLSRNALSAHFDLSVTPIRDALMRLEEEGLVDIYPQHATRVRGISIASARQAHFLRLSIELELGRTLAHRQDAALGQALHSLVPQQRAALQAADLASVNRVDLACHKHVGRIQGLVVAERARGAGVARALLRAVQDEARHRGARRLALRVLGHNTAARKLYESEGVAVEGLLPEEFLLDGAYVDDVLMGRRL